MAASLSDSSVFFDTRGYFLELFTSSELKQQNVNFNDFQINLSKSNMGVIRGLHLNLKPTYKFVRCIEGEILDCVLSVNPSHDDFGCIQTFELSSFSPEILIVPPGHAHGFQVLSSTATVVYLVNRVYDSTDDIGINALDPELRIQWRTLDITIMSDKDKTLQNWRDFKDHNFFGGLG